MKGMGRRHTFHSNPPQQPPLRSVPDKDNATWRWKVFPSTQDVVEEQEQVKIDEEELWETLQSVTKEEIFDSSEWWMMEGRKRLRANEGKWRIQTSRFLLKFCK